MRTIGIASGDYLRIDLSPDGEPKWGGSGWARIGQYLPYFAEEYNVVVGILNSYEGKLVIQDDRTKEFHSPDILITQRLMHAGIAEDSKRSIQDGMVIIQDIDDWYWALDQRNQAWAASHPSLHPDENRDHYSRAIKNSSLIVASTPWIAESSAKRFGGVPVEIIGNYVDTDRFSRVDQDVDVPVLGWAGSTMHRSGDLETLKGIITQVTGDYKLFHGGHDPSGEAPTFADRVGVDEELVTKAPLVNSEDYPKLLQMNVGLIPLRDTAFNHAKSDIKGLEYAACGIPFVASHSPSYDALHRSWEGAFDLVRKPKQWLKALRSYTDAGYRMERSDEVYERSLSRGIRQGADAWLELLRSL